jgi:putative ABC transport system substrate-binding protein
VLRIALSTKTIRTAAELSEAFKSMREEQVQAVVVFGNVFSYRNRAQISSLALKYNLPTMCEFGQWVQAGALMAYYPPSDELFRLTAEIVGQILHGAAPGDVPIQQPTTFALSLNLKTAKALGITIPESILLRADEVIR